jgi:hypothetical protein
VTFSSISSICYGPIEDLKYFSGQAKQKNNNNKNKEKGQAVIFLDRIPVPIQIGPEAMC